MPTRLSLRIQAVLHKGTAECRSQDVSCPASYSGAYGLKFRPSSTILGEIFRISPQFLQKKNRNNTYNETTTDFDHIPSSELSIIPSIFEAVGLFYCYLEESLY